MNSTINLAILLAFISFVSATNSNPSEKDVTNLINEVDSEKSLYVFSGLTIDRVENGAKSFGSISENESLLDRTERYLSTHELNFSFDAEEAKYEATGRALDEYRSKKMKKILIPFLLAIKIKLALVMKVLLMIVKFISLKALAASMLALILSGATFFKDLLAKKKDHITTAYITGSPAAEIVHSDGWNRNGQASAQELAYNYHSMGQPAY